MKPKPPLEGYERKWLRCRRCRRVYHYDYVPFSLSNPIMWTHCGHSLGERDLGCDEIPGHEALAALEATTGAWGHG